MMNKVKILFKGNKFLYNIYYYLGTLGVNFLKKFLTPQDNLILFMSYGGQRFDDSPRVIYEQMIDDSRYDNFDIVWVFNDPQEYHITRGRKIKTDTFRFYITALKAKCWITNSTVERGLEFKGKNTFYFNTWHGTPLKKMGTDIDKNSKSFRTKGKWEVDKFICQSLYEMEIFSRVFGVEKTKFLNCGLPRNDELLGSIGIKREKIRNQLGIPKDKTVILYAPTFREYNRDSMKNCIFSSPFNIEKWEKSIGEDYFILFRAHYEVSKIIDIPKDSTFIKDMSAYPVLNELMIASDILISDYSSIFFDYSLLNQPMFHFTYDYDEYYEKRGLYFDIRMYLPGSALEDELLKYILEYPKEKAIDKTINFKNKYVEYSGKSTQTCLNIIYESIKKEELL